MGVTAQTEYDRLAARFKELGEGEPGIARGGGNWTLPKRQFQALYFVVGTMQEAIELQPELVPWPIDSVSLKPIQPSMLLIYKWCREIDAGETEIDDKQFKIMDARIMRRFKSQVRRGIVSSSKALQTVSDKITNGEEVSKIEQLSLIPLSNNTNYGVSSYAQLHKATESAPSQNIQIGRLTLNAGAPPPSKRKLNKKVKKLMAAPAIDAEYREVPVAATG